ncbi:hypothetical protein PRIPAC_74521 [Pristionchus pacificus]|uniref:Uncharacterized protein n=1 Tax=Pristionchus pacificus TaxID=54126 RepID=A0A2A6CSS7_PRIPA|nr:hypothetical protein PRIPAC_74521 [Pristionchus pacificus]|eukprot:PDM81272.1 hypothetical protein PRIPAC_36275 [Pristionchus pacificus]
MSASPLATLQSSCSLSNHSLSFIYPSLLSHSLDLPIHSRMIKLILLLVLLAIAVSYVEAQWGWGGPGYYGGYGGWGGGYGGWRRPWWRRRWGGGPWGYGGYGGW